MQTLIGHQPVLDLLVRMHQSGKLGNAVLLVGPEGVGKRAIAERLISEIVGGGELGAGNAAHPDVSIVGRERIEEDELKKNISIEQIRELRRRLQMSAFYGGKKVGLIDEAELLSTDASNALLKTLEDPHGDALVILLSTSLEAMLPTVRSRCQIIYVPLVSRALISAALVANGMNAAEANALAVLSGGRPGLALRLASDTEARSAFEQEMNTCRELLASGGSGIYRVAQELGKRERSALSTTLDAWEMVLHEDLTSRPPEKTVRLFTRVFEARAAIAQNVSPSLALEHIFI